MSKVQQVINDEMSRLARKEAHKLLKPILEKMSSMRKTIQLQAKRLAVLEKNGAVTVPSEKKSSSLVAAEAENSGKQVRLATKNIIVLRKKLGLTQGEFAKALGINPFTVSHWEKGKTVPRDAQKRAICALRSLKKHDLAKLYAERGITKNAMKTPGRKKGAVKKAAGKKAAVKEVVAVEMVKA